jgi:hypothetical protein
MQILIINDFAHVNGGATQVALNSALGLAEQVDKVILFAAVKPIMPELHQSGIPVICTGQQEIAKDSNRLRAVRKNTENRKVYKNHNGDMK